MNDAVSLPDWVPSVAPGSRILVAGASGGIGLALLDMLTRGAPCVIGAHRRAGAARWPASPRHPVHDLPRALDGDADCRALVDAFVAAASGLDALVVLTGGITASRHWRELDESQWRADIDLNLNMPFFLARAAMERLDAGGRVVLMGTESALHGGGATSLAYGTAKRGVECLVQGLAREGAGRGILVNGVRPGFIASGFHQRWQGYGEDTMERRVGLIPLKRAGLPEEVAALIVFLLSGWSQFITGQMFAVTGGDWL